MAYLVLVRHGESEWNAQGLWTGLTDIPLSEKGKKEAQTAAHLIKDIPFDVVFTSALTRAKQTFDEMKSVLSQNNPLQIFEEAAINERDYGDLTGKNKWEIKKHFGEKQFLKWRRSWEESVPGGESLKDVYNRVIPYYQKNILPCILKGQNVLIVAHGNSLRALIKYLENISDSDIPTVEIKTGQIYLYTIDKTGEIISKEIRG